jgi:hypothetical protein
MLHGRGRQSPHPQGCDVFRAGGQAATQARLVAVLREPLLPWLADPKLTIRQHISSMAGAAPITAGARATSSQAARDGLCRLPRASKSPLQVRPPCRSASPPSASAAGGALAAASSCGRSAPRLAGPSPAIAWLPGGTAGAQLAGSARDQGPLWHVSFSNKIVLLSGVLACVPAWAAPCQISTMSSGCGLRAKPAGA